MTTTPSGGLAALDHAGTAFDKLDRLCCDPGRSPRMAALREAITEIRKTLPAAMGDRHATSRLLGNLEETGAQIGRLQIGCCAPARLPLYAQMLEDLTTIQRELNRAIGEGH